MDTMDTQRVDFDLENAPPADQYEQQAGSAFHQTINQR